MSNKKHISETDASLWAQLTKDVKPLSTTKPIPPPQQKIPKNIVPNYIFEPNLDLHGYTVQDAFNQVDQQLYQAQQIGQDKVTIITGKSGTISSEFSDWIRYRSDVKKAKPKNNGGAWDIWIKRT